MLGACSRQAYAERGAPNRTKRIALVAKIAIFAAVAVMVVRFALTYRLPRVPEDNDQMAPAMPGGSKVMVHLGYKRAVDFQRGDIVAYAARSADGRATLRFGRVAGLPEDRVEMKSATGRAADGEVSVNGEPIAYSAELITGAEGAPSRGAGQAIERTTVVPDGALYLVNDAAASRLADSRSAGPIPETCFVGKVVMTLSW